MRCINHFYFLFLFSNNIKCTDVEKIKLDNNVTIYVESDNSQNTYWTQIGFECNKKITPSDFYNLENFLASNKNNLTIDKLDESYKIIKIENYEDGFIDYEKKEFDKIEKYWITFLKTNKLPNESEIEIDNKKLDLAVCYFYFDNCKDNEEDFLKCIYRFNKDKINIKNFVNDYGIHKYYSHKSKKIETCYLRCFSDTISELLQSIKENKKLVLEIVKKINYSVLDIKLSKDLEKVYKFISDDEKNKIINIIIMIVP